MENKSFQAIEDIRWAELKKSSPTIADIRWAEHHGWLWDANNRIFYPAPVVEVIVNPNDKLPGWVPWLPAIGALQTDAPFSSVRAALRVAESIRLQRTLEIDEMNCSKEVG